MSVARPPIRVLVAEDHPLYRKGLGDAIRSRPDFALVSEVADGRKALEAIREYAPDVAVLDIKMPELDGISVLRAVERDGLVTRVILLSAFTGGEVVHAALTHGVSGFLSKHSSGAEICDAVGAVARGDTIIGREMQAALAGELRLRGTSDAPRLSERETEVLRLLAEGLSSGDIADRLAVSATTVKTHLRNLYYKLEVSDRAAAVAQAMRGGLLE